VRLTGVAGAVLTALLAGIAGRAWGTPAAVAAAIFGAIATAIQVAAIRLMAPVRAPPSGATFSKYMGRWGAGMGLRFLGVVLLALAAGLDPVHFPPLAGALGFLGVLLPLLVLEVRLVR
jgi:hypothetical protein